MFLNDSDSIHVHCLSLPDWLVSFQKPVLLYFDTDVPDEAHPMSPSVITMISIFISNYFSKNWLKLPISQFLFFMFNNNTLNNNQMQGITIFLTPIGCELNFDTLTIIISVFICYFVYT